MKSGLLQLSKISPFAAAIVDVARLTQTGHHPHPLNCTTTIPLPKTNPRFGHLYWNQAILGVPVPGPYPPARKRDSSVNILVYKPSRKRFRQTLLHAKLPFSTRTFTLDYPPGLSPDFGRTLHALFDTRQSWSNADPNQDTIAFQVGVS